MKLAKAKSPQERVIQTARTVPRRVIAAMRMTAEGRGDVRPGLRAMTVPVGMTAVAVTTVQTGKAVRIGRASPTAQTVQIGLTARAGLIGQIGLIGLIEKIGKTATTVRTDRAGRTERAVEVLLAILLRRAATNPSVASTKLIHIKRSTVFPCRST